MQRESLASRQPLACPADRMSSIPFSGVRKIFEKANKLEKKGRSVIHMEIGRPDFDTPAHIKSAAVEALQNAKVHYTSNYGILPLREAIARKLCRENALEYCPMDEIIVTAGVSEGIMMVMMGLLNPGDEVLVMDPVFPAYPAAIRLAGAVPVPVYCIDQETFQLRLSDLEASVSPKTRLLVIANPCNPTGVVLDTLALHAIAECAIRHDLLVLSDEIYEKIVYAGSTVKSLGSLPGMRDRTITLNGFSKTYAMTGWRVGYLAAKASIVQSLVRVHQYTVVCATSFAQWGALAALECAQDCVKEMLNHYDRRRQLVLEALGSIPNLKFVVPEGAFYVYIDTLSIGWNAYELAEALLEMQGVAVVPWDASHIRISFAIDTGILQDAMRRFQLVSVQKMVSACG